MMIEVRYCDWVTTPLFCYDYEKRMYHLELPKEYWDDEEKTAEIIARAEKEISIREGTKCA